MFEKRVRLLSRLALLAFLLLLARVAWLQIWCCREYRGLSKQHAIKRVELEPFRGAIRDRHGTPLAVDRPCFDLAVKFKRLAGSPVVTREQVRDWPGLCRRIVSHRDGPAHHPCARVWARLPRRAKYAVWYGSRGAALTERRQKRILKAINATLRREGFFVEADAERLRLSALGQELLERRCDHLFTREARVLNRLVLDTALAGSVLPVQTAWVREPWRQQIVAVAGIGPDELRADVERITSKVRKVKDHLYKRTGREIRIREEAAVHTVVHDVGLDAVSRFRLHPERYDGIELRVTTRRHCPQGDLAAHTIGYLQAVNPHELKRHRHEYDGSPEKRYRALDLIGRSGAERTYNRYLRGWRGERIEVKSTKDRRVSKIIIEKPPVAGHDAYLTIDVDVQRAAEQALGPQKGAIVVLRPHTGEILALVSSPRYDLATLRADYARLRVDTENAPLLDRSIAALLPPGSVLKVVTALTGMSCGQIGRWQTCTCRGAVVVHGVRFGCWAPYGHGVMNLHEALVESCNVYFFEAARRLTGKQMLDGLRRFGFGAKVALDIPAERAPSLPKLRSTAERMNVSCGQGAMLATPLHVAVMISVVANGGRLVRPHLTYAIVSQDGSRAPLADRPPAVQVVDPALVRIVAEALAQVPQRGTARGVGLERFRVACKTGTAQTSHEDVNHAWLAGYAPHDDPKLAFAIVLEKVSGHGGEMAGPVVTKMLDLIQASKRRVTAHAGARVPQTARAGSDVMP